MDTQNVRMVGRFFQNEKKSLHEKKEGFFTLIIYTRQ